MARLLAGDNSTMMDDSSLTLNVSKPHDDSVSPSNVLAKKPISGHKKAKKTSKKQSADFDDDSFLAGLTNPSRKKN